ncbi:uncharacterized protein LOC122078636 isoform X2 [Macadamia integrifolia]|uniref:uncharacterized protein LOC122078636 isoform X2 n=1 Tax=Macadamia integrifolia TaxID=60698 RepID=UPI001C4F2268|nr:uncharacterized protein LOC122078636 isoform X2 [Macadamia integrifolia]
MQFLPVLGSRSGTSILNRDFESVNRLGDYGEIIMILISAVCTEVEAFLQKQSADQSRSLSIVFSALICKIFRFVECLSHKSPLSAGWIDQFRHPVILSLHIYVRCSQRILRMVRGNSESSDIVIVKEKPKD